MTGRFFHPCWLALVALLVSGCGSDSEAPAAAPPEPVAESAEESPEAPPPEAAEPAPTPAPPAPPGEPVDLLHAVPSAVAVSSVYRDRAEQVGRLVDDDAESAWNSRTGDLVGAWIDVRLPQDVAITGIALTAGFDRRTDTADLFSGNHRIAAVRVTRRGTVLALQTLDPEVRGLQAVPFEATGGDLRVEVTQVHAGTREDWRETCVSDFRVLGRSAIAQPGRYEPTLTVGALGPLPEALEMVEIPDDELLDPVDYEGPVAVVVVMEGDTTRVVLLHEGEFQQDVDESTAACSGPDGSVWALKDDALSRLAGSRPGRVLTLPRSLEGAYRVKCHAEGRLTVDGPGGWGEYDGAEWTYVSANAVEGSPRAVALDETGQSWVVTDRGLYHREGEAFVAVPLPEEAGAPRGFAQDPRGPLVVRTGAGLAWREGSSWRFVSMRPSGGPDGRSVAAAIREDGTLVVAVGHQLVTRGGTGPARVVDLGPEFRFHYPSGLAFDAAGRLWVTAASGLFVLSRDLSGVVREYGGADDLIGTFLDVLAFGAIEPLPPSQPQTGHMHGRLVHDGEPLANQRFQVCIDPTRGSLGSMADPCEESSQVGLFARYSTTRADGTFDVYGAPETDLHFSALRSGQRRHSITRSSPCCEGRPGVLLELGDVELR